MIDDLHKCPECNGLGIIPAFLKPISIPCQMCNGAGKVKDKHLKWRLLGQELRDYRLNVLRLTLRKAAKQFGIDAANLSKMERGILKPQPIYGALTAWNNRKEG